MTKDANESDNAPLPEKKERIYDEGTRFSLTSKQLSGAAFGIVSALFAFIVYAMNQLHGIDTRLNKSDILFTHLNEKIEKASISSDRFRKLEMEIENLKDSNKEIRSKVFK